MPDHLQTILFRNQDLQHEKQRHELHFQVLKHQLAVYFHFGIRISFNFQFLCLNLVQLNSNFKINLTKLPYLLILKREINCINYFILSIKNFIDGLNLIILIFLHYSLESVNLIDQLSKALAMSYLIANECLNYL